MSNDNKIDLRKVNKQSTTSKLRGLGKRVGPFFLKKDTKNRDKVGRFKTGSGGLASVKKINWARVVPLILVVAITGGLLVFRSNAASTPTGPYGVDPVAEDEQFYAINAARLKQNSAVKAKNPQATTIKSLTRKSCMDSVARDWARSLARANKLSHNLKANATAIATKCKYTWASAGENVGYGPTSVAIYEAFYASEGHRANILNPKFTLIGIGSWRNSVGRLYIVHIFMKLA